MSVTEWTVKSYFDFLQGYFEFSLHVFYFALYVSNLSRADHPLWDIYYIRCFGVRYRRIFLRVVCKKGGRGGLNLPIPVPFNPGFRPVFVGSRLVAFFRLRNFALFLLLPAPSSPAPRTSCLPPPFLLVSHLPSPFTENIPRYFTPKHLIRDWFIIQISLFQPFAVTWKKATSVTGWAHAHYLITITNCTIYHNSVNCDRPGECSPEKDCLRWHWLTFRQPERKSSSESSELLNVIGAFRSVFC